MSVAARKPFSIGLVSLCVLVAALTLGSAPALAAAPETPEIKVESVTAKTATFNGVLSPKSPGELGSTYQFLYRISKTECKGESEAPQSPGMSLGGEAEGVSEPVSGLTPNTGYTVCLLAENAAKTAESVSMPAHFTTALEAPETLIAEPVGVTTATLKGVLSPNATVAGEPASYEFLYRQSATECQGGEVEEDQATPVSGASGSRQEAAAPVTGLLPGTQYTFCLLERNAANETAVGPAVTFTTHGVGITEEQVTSVETTAATLQADIDPNELSTSYHFEYDTTPYTSSAPHGTSITARGGEEINIGSGTSPEPVAVKLEGLQPGGTYYYRVVATDQIETFDGPGKTFTMPAAPGSEPAQSCPNEQLRLEQSYGARLPDCRAYERVSSPANGDVTEPSLANRAAVSGDAITFESHGAAVPGEPEGARLNNQFLAQRTATGWTMSSISPPFFAYEADAGDPPYSTLVFTPELTAGVGISDVSLAAGAPEGDYEFYRADFATHAYQWASKEYPGEPQPEKQYDEENLRLMAADSGLEHVVYDVSTCEFPGLCSSVYEWNNEEAVRVDVANNGEPLFGRAGAGSQSYGPFEDNTDTWHAVSSDGSHVFFTSSFLPAEGNRRSLYVRENPAAAQSPMEGARCVVPGDACTMAISSSERLPEDPNGPQYARFQGANADGSKVFFTSRAELTQDANTGPDDNAANLYEYDFSKPEGHRLTDLSVDASEPLGASVKGVAQISEDGAYVYFVADGVLAHSANPLGQQPVAGRPNLYVSESAGGLAFIATLKPIVDSTDWGRGTRGLGGQLGGPARNTASVSAAGTALAFMVSLPLTGYDNFQAKQGGCERGVLAAEIAEGESEQEVIKGSEEAGHCREVYVYNKAARTLECASCDPSGARPLGPSALYSEEAKLAEAPGVAVYRPRNISSDGTVFFQTLDALIPSDSNGREDVYEYKDGSVAAISDVTGKSDSYLMDVSASGDDVFIGTSDALLGGIPSDLRAVYDARVDGGFPPPPAAQECDNGDACKPPAAAQPAVFGAPATATFSGSGNLAPTVTATVTPKQKTVAAVRAEKLARALKICRKDRRRRERARCERHAKSKYGAAKQATRAGDNPRTK